MKGRRQLQEQCKLVLEENQLLMEQLDVHENKTRDMHAAHVHEVVKLTQQLAVSAAERNELEREVDELRRHCEEMKQHLDVAVVDNKCKVALDDHMMTVSQLKRSQEDDQMKHETEISELSVKVKTLLIEQNGLTLKVEQLQSEKKLLESQEKSLHKANRKAQRQIVTLEKAVEDAKCNEYTVDHYLTKVLTAAKESQVEMETYVNAVLEQAENSKVTLSSVIGDKAELIKMVHKFKMFDSYEELASSKSNPIYCELVIMFWSGVVWTSPKCDIAITFWFGEIMTSPKCNIGITFSFGGVWTSPKCDVAVTF
ncbi:Centrosomal protein of 89 kDa [Lamellibrachia satsuma]|nr:Centrosomal protein of 89 kDa [Lamellibrachia satsuma]